MALKSLITVSLNEATQDRLVDRGNDAGGVSVYAQMGQDYGMKLLWTLVLLFPILYVCQEMVVRLGAVSGVGHGKLIFARFGKFWAAFSVFDLFVINAVTIVVEFIGVEQSLSFFGMSSGGDRRGGQLGIVQARVDERLDLQDEGVPPTAGRNRADRSRPDDEPQRGRRSCWAFERPSRARVRWSWSLIRSAMSSAAMCCAEAWPGWPVADRISPRPLSASASPGRSPSSRNRVRACR